MRRARVYNGGRNKGRCGDRVNLSLSVWSGERVAAAFLCFLGVVVVVRCGHLPFTTMPQTGVCVACMVPRFVLPPCSSSILRVVVVGPSDY